MGPFDANWLIAAIVLTTPILLAATGELIAERAGIFNIGLEGMMLLGAFCGFIAEWQTGSASVGVLVALLSGTLLAALMAFLSIELNADQVVVGVGLNILALGVTTFAFEQIFADRAQVLLQPVGGVAIPGLSNIPWIGEALFDQSLLGYFAFLAVPSVWFLLQKTALGLSIRAAGELPEAVTTAGISVKKVRWAATLAAGAFAGLGGAFLSVVSLGLFIQGMSAGRGYIAVAAVIFGGWRVGGVLAACFVFGGADALQLRLQAVGFIPRQVWVVALAVPIVFVAYRLVRRRGIMRGAGAGSTVAVAACIALLGAAPRTSLPSQLWLALPYVLALFVLAGFVGRPKMPTALGIPLRSDDEHA
jgi:simple sugar transport system permease protein